MKLHFDPNQTYQQDAVNAVTGIFEGQELENSEFSLCTAGEMFSEMGFGNMLFSSKKQIKKRQLQRILENVKAIQQRNGIESVASDLQGMNFSVEMETGTGKTYVYLRTIYEMNKLYGFRKFVIVVPSIAIREGVLKNLHVTHEHFQSLYDNVSLSFEVYDSKKVSNLRNFALSNVIQVLVLNIDAFAKHENIINKSNDRLSGKSPIEFIQAASPIVIVDEPQNMETNNSKRAIRNLKPLCTLRYSATHTNLYNLVYSLNPVKAYDLGLVKQIEVDSVVSGNAMNDAYIKVENVLNRRKSEIVAKIQLNVNTPQGVKRKSVIVNHKHGFDLFKLSGEREVYRDLYIEEIDVQSQSVSLSNGQTLVVGETQGGSNDEVQKYMIRRTVEEHLKKEVQYAKKGVKVLSLFFIDRVKNYRDDSESRGLGKFARWFEEIYSEEIRNPKYAALKKFKVEAVHGGYFSQDRKRKLKDTDGDTQDDNDTYKTIMRDKEHLLDITTPLRFIFSHSALREGWDNPNVFQICTLNETQSGMKKRQEIGRGLRLCVDDSGRRIYDKDINCLTVIANESYDNFAKALQQEIEENCGVDFRGRVKNGRGREQVSCRKDFQMEPKFLEIWNRIKDRTRYNVSCKTEELIKCAGKAVKDMPDILRPSVYSMRVGIRIGADGVSVGSENSVTDEGNLKSIPPDSVLVGGNVLPDIISYIQAKTTLTRKTIFDIIQESGRIKDFIVNPQMFMDNAVCAIKKTLCNLMVNGIKYEKMLNEIYEMTLVDNAEFQNYIGRNTYKISKPDMTIDENNIPTDTKVKYPFAKNCENNENNIDFYFKLPDWFKISTPIGKYNPDWAVVLKGESKVYFIAETRGGLGGNCVPANY
jgi:type III restriction enzyme